MKCMIIVLMLSLMHPICDPPFHKSTMLADLRRLHIGKKFANMSLTKRGSYHAL